MEYEVWRKINDNYSVSSLGKVRNDKLGKLLKGSINTRGYHTVTIYGKTYCSHRLVAQFYIENPLLKPHVNHLDGNKLNNNASNLEWVTDKENKHHAYLNGFYDRHIKSISHPIRGVSLLTNEIIEFNSAWEASRNGFSQSCINSCIRGKRKSHKGYCWERIIDDMERQPNLLQ